MGRKWFTMLLLIFAGCSGHSGEMHISITLINGHVLTIKGVTADIAGEIQRDSAAWQELFPVYRMPADTDMKDFQRPQPGSYSLVGAAVLFAPDTPFINGQTYFLRCYQFGEGKGSWDIIKRQRKLGSQAYTDLTFKK